MLDYQEHNAFLLVLLFREISLQSQLSSPPVSKYRGNYQNCLDPPPPLRPPPVFIGHPPGSFVYGLISSTQKFLVECGCGSKPLSFWKLSKFKQKKVSQQLKLLVFCTLLLYIIFSYFFLFVIILLLSSLFFFFAVIFLCKYFGLVPMLDNFSTCSLISCQQ